MSTEVIKTFLRVNGQFVPMDNFSGNIINEYYIEGAISCTIDGYEIFKMSQWDLIDQLWAYIIEGLRRLNQGLDYDSFFPDQPLRLRFEPIAQKRLKITIGEESNYVSEATFISTMKRGAMEFFSKMKDIVPNAVGTWDRYQKEAEMIRS